MAGSDDNNVYLFDRTSSTPLWNYTTGNYVYPVAISSHGQYIAAGSGDNNVYLFNRTSSTPLWTYATE
ncbi:MAG: PQQ-binding-like beta-propeller repeat protein, partial [Candidatus Hodarchaeota archaeon]